MCCGRSHTAGQTPTLRPPPPLRNRPRPDTPVCAPVHIPNHTFTASVVTEDARDLTASELPNILPMLLKRSFTLAPTESSRSTSPADPDAAAAGRGPRGMGTAGGYRRTSHTTRTRNTDTDTHEKSAWGHGVTPRGVPLQTVAATSPPLHPGHSFNRRTIPARERCTPHKCGGRRKASARGECPSRLHCVASRCAAHPTRTPLATPTH